MKRDFFDYMLEIMRNNPDVYFIMLGLGYPRVDEFLKEFPDRAYNFEASEQTGLDSAVGLSYAGKIPVVYTITPFYWRAAETIRTYIAHENLHIIMIGVGRGDDYSKIDGYSHDGDDIKDLMNAAAIENVWFPKDVDQMQTDISFALKEEAPTFISIPK